MKLDFTIDTLGPATVQSPLDLSTHKAEYQSSFVSDDHCLLYDIETDRDAAPVRVAPNQLLEIAGPRHEIYFDPAKLRAGIVTCGGLCPGLNDVIRAIVMCLWHRYGVKQISGFRFGYRGLLSEFGLPVVELTPETVVDIHREGGTILGSSRGHGDRTSDMVDCLQRMNLNVLFTIGGDGTQRGALDIAKEARKRGLNIAVVGVPKTIDNDLSFVEKSFGFQTAVSEAVAAVAGAHVEAHDAPNGIAIVKLMGRESGFIAAHTALAINDVNYVLIPEVPFALEGENGLCANVARRLAKRNHAVILVAEGAGQEHLDTSGAADASGNNKLTDIGLFLKDALNAYFKQHDLETNLKYIDPSYIIRSAPANADDSVYCQRLGANAVHAAMAGKTGLLISLLHSRLVHVPIAMATMKKNCIDPNAALWRDVTEATGQPLLLCERRKKVRTSRKKKQ
jgi:6-phosphofructokinase 1